MKRPMFRLAAVAMALVALVPMTSVRAQSQTETKIRLMAEALRERDAGEPMHVRQPPAHANTMMTARRPIAQRMIANIPSATSRARPRQPNHSASTARRPIGACTATASTNTE